MKNLPDTVHCTESGRFYIIYLGQYHTIWQGRIVRCCPLFYYFPGLKLSFRLTERLKTRCSGEESLLSGQK